MAGRDGTILRRQVDIRREPDSIACDDHDVIARYGLELGVARVCPMTKDYSRRRETKHPAEHPDSRATHGVRYYPAFTRSRNTMIDGLPTGV